MASLNEILNSCSVSLKSLGSAFNNPETSFQIMTSSASFDHAKIAAE